jgi:hypothetical protein
VQKSIADYLEDVAHNGMECGAGLVVVEADESDPWFRVTVADNGPGMDEETKARAMDPFGSDPAMHPGRKVGLGLPFLAEAARASGGEFDLRSEPGTGTSVHFAFDRRNVDAPPAGDLASTWTSLMNFATGRCELAIRRTRGDRSWSVTRSELEDAAGPLDRADALSRTERFFRDLESDDTGSGR